MSSRAQLLQRQTAAAAALATAAAAAVLILATLLHVQLVQHVGRGLPCAALAAVDADTHEESASGPVPVKQGGEKEVVVVMMMMTTRMMMMMMVTVMVTMMPMITRKQTNAAAKQRSSCKQQLAPEAVLIHEGDTGGGERQGNCSSVTKFVTKTSAHVKTRAHTNA